jgi:hypothetical protein
VRLTTPIFPGEQENDADKRLQQFMHTLMPSLAGFLPSEGPSTLKPAMTPLKASNS